MQILSVRPDGVMVWADDGDQPWKAKEHRVFIKWDDVKLLEHTRQGYEAEREKARAERKTRKK